MSTTCPLYTHTVCTISGVSAQCPTNRNGITGASQGRFTHGQHPSSGERDDGDYVTNPRARAQAEAFGHDDDYRPQAPQHTQHSTGNQHASYDYGEHDNDEQPQPDEYPGGDYYYDDTPSNRVTRHRRSHSVVSYDGNPAEDERALQRRRVSSQSPPPEVEDEDPEHDEDEELGEEDEDDGFELPRSEYPKARRIVDYAKAKGRPKQSDYDPEAQEVMALANVHYKSMIMSDHAFPGQLDQKTWAVTAWYRAAEKLDIKLAPTTEIVRLVSTIPAHSQLRSTDFPLRSRSTPGISAVKSRPRPDHSCKRRTDSRPWRLLPLRITIASSLHASCVHAPLLTRCVIDCQPVHLANERPLLDHRCRRRRARGLVRSPHHPDGG